MRAWGKTAYIKIILLLIITLAAAVAFLSCGEAPEETIAEEEPYIVVEVPVIDPPEEEPDPALQIFDARLEMIEMIQPDNEGHLTEGCDTVIKATFSGEIDEVFADGIPLCYVSVFRDDGFALQFPATGYPPGNTLSFQPKTIADADGWAAGSYTIEFYIDDSDEPAAILKEEIYSGDSSGAEPETYPELPEDSDEPVILDEYDLPEDWSDEELLEALSKGLILPMERLDMPVSREQYLRLLEDFYYEFSKSGEPFSLDVSDSDYGVDFFTHPHKSLTQEEAAILMCKTVAITIKDFYGAGQDVEKILESLMSYGVLNKYGPDAYVPSEKLSKKLALIRMNRLYDAVVSDKLRVIAKGFDFFQCDDAAYAMRAELIREGKHGSIINMYYPGEYYIYTETTSRGKTTVSSTGIHLGVLYAGRVHCNIFPGGLPEKKWLASFYEPSGKRPRLEYVPF